MDSCFKLKKSMEGIVLHAWRLRPTKGDSFALPRAFAAAKWVMNAKVQLYAAGNGPHALASRTMLNVVEVFWYDAWAQACQALKRGDYVALSGDGIVALARTAREMPVFVLSGPPAGLQVASAIRFRLWPAAAKAKGDGTTQRVHAALALDLTHASVSDSARAAEKEGKSTQQFCWLHVHRARCAAARRSQRCRRRGGLYAAARNYERFNDDALADGTVDSPARAERERLRAR